MNRFLRLSENEKKAKWSDKIFTALLLCAKNKESITYTEMACLLGDETLFASLNPVLKPIQEWCEYHNHPPLEDLIVKAGTGMPGHIRMYTREYWGFEDAQKSIFEYDWDTVAKHYYVFDIEKHIGEVYG